jgi:hypothetical protein
VVGVDDGGCVGALEVGALEVGVLEGGAEVGRDVACVGGGGGVNVGAGAWSVCLAGTFAGGGKFSIG